MIAIKYLVVQRRHRAGFFSDFFWALAGIKIADQLGLIPVIDFGDLTKEQEKKQNWKWSDYFKNPRFTEFENLCKSAVFLSDSKHPNVNIMGDFVSDNQELQNLFVRYSGFSSQSETVLKNVSKLMLDRSALAVHFRTGDMRLAPSHPTPPTRWQVISAIEKELAERTYDTLYIATQNLRDCAKIKKHFNSKVELLSRKEMKLIQAGSIEVLADSLAMSHAKTIICSESNIIAGSIFFASHRPRLLILDNGRNPARNLASLTHGTLSFTIKHLLRTPTLSLTEVESKTEQLRGFDGMKENS